jgi:hypothetical protein
MKPKITALNDISMPQYLLKLKKHVEMKSQPHPMASRPETKPNGTKKIAARINKPIAILY